MKFNLKYKGIEEELELPSDDYTISDLLKDMELSSQSLVCKQNNELVIEETIINDGDEINLIQIIYGG